MEISNKIHNKIQIGYPRKGLGIGWDVSFSNQNFESAENKILEISKLKVGTNNGKTCQFQERKLVTKTGTCSSSIRCHVGNVDYLGSYCLGLLPGNSCNIETDQITLVKGTCSEGGHCRGLQGHVRHHHEVCSDASGTLGVDHHNVGKVKQFLRKQMKTDPDDEKPVITKENSSEHFAKSENLKPHFASYSYKCRGLYNPAAYQKLRNICTDCYNLYKEPEVHTLCMSGCFDSPYFFTCVKSLMMEEEMVQGLVKMVGK